MARMINGIATALITLTSFSGIGGKTLAQDSINSHEEQILVTRKDFQISENWKLPRIMNKDFWLMGDPLMDRCKQYRESSVKNEPMIKALGICTIAQSPKLRTIVEQDIAKFPPLVLSEIQVYETDGTVNIASQAKAEAEGQVAGFPQQAEKINDGDISSECVANFSFTLRFSKAYKINRIVVFQGQNNNTVFTLEYLTANGKTFAKIPGIQKEDVQKSSSKFSFPAIETTAIRVLVDGRSVPLLLTVKNVNKLLDASKIDFSKVPLLLIPGETGGFRRANLPYADFTIDKTEYAKFLEKHKFAFFRFFPGEWENDFHICANWDGRWTDYRKKTGFDTVVPKPATRAEAVSLIRDYYTKRNASYFGNLLDFSSSVLMNHYPLEWGAEACGIETTGFGAPSHQIQVVFARGAARQYNTYWCWYLAYFWNSVYPVSTMAPPMNDGGAGTGEKRFSAGPYAGISTSLAMRDMYLSYLNGAAFLANESWPDAFFQPTVKDDYNSVWKLSQHGETLKKWFAFTQKNPERGISYTPIALLFDYCHGWSPSAAWKPKDNYAWYCFPPESQDNMITSFMYTLFPWKPDRAYNDTHLFNSPYGDIYDALIANPPSGKLNLSPYKVAVLLGGIKPDKILADKLKDYVRNGGTLVINAKQVTPEISTDFLGASLSGENRPCGKKLKSLLDNETFALPEKYDCGIAKLNGAVTILADENKQPIMTVNNYGKGKVILTTPNWMVENNLTDYRKKSPLVQFILKHIVPDVLPLKIEGDIEYGLNKMDDGWLVYLINNKGVYKKPLEDATFDLRETSRVKLSFFSKPQKILELKEDKEIKADKFISIEVPPGDIRIIKIID